MEQESVILGIDPGSRVTGYGVIRSTPRKQVALCYGCIRPPVTAPTAEKYKIIFESVEQLIDTYHPTAISIETQFVYKNAQSALKLSMAKAMILLAAARKQIPIFEYAPKKAKNAVVGNGAASKEQVQKMLQILLNLASPPKPEDASDALALAFCHANTLQKRIAP